MPGIAVQNTGSPWRPAPRTHLTYHGPQAITPPDLHAPRPDAYLVAYSADATAQQTAVEAVFGRTGTPGLLPVSIPGMYSYGEGIDLQPTDPE